jgi:ATP-dependent protease ClpP protease subunit
MSNEPVTVIINSFGGLEDEALAIVGRMRASPCEIITEGYGAVQSAATMILAAGDFRRASRYSRFMSHEGSYSLDGQHSTIASEVEWRKIMESRWCGFLAEFSKKPKSFWAKAIRNQSQHLTAEQLLAYGIVDELI